MGDISETASSFIPKSPPCCETRHWIRGLEVDEKGRPAGSPLEERGTRVRRSTERGSCSQSTTVSRSLPGREGDFGMDGTGDGWQLATLLLDISWAQLLLLGVEKTHSLGETRLNWRFRAISSYAQGAGWLGPHL